MATTIDSYSETAADTYGGVWANFPGDGQSFTCSVSGFTLSSCQFYLKKIGSPTGNATACLYAHTGTYGTSSLPTGAALATSDNFNVATLTTSAALTTFNFTGANKVALTTGTYYVITVEFAGGDVSNYVDIGLDNSSPGHSGNRVYKPSGTWTAVDYQDVCFYVYGINETGFLVFL